MVLFAVTFTWGVVAHPPAPPCPKENLVIPKIVRPLGGVRVKL